jgi:hypothetical protein
MKPIVERNCKFRSAFVETNSAQPLIKINIETPLSRFYSHPFVCNLLPKDILNWMVKRTFAKILRNYGF